MKKHKKYSKERKIIKGEKKKNYVQILEKNCINRFIVNLSIIKIMPNKV